LYSLFVKDKQDTCISDTNATKNYVSRTFALAAGVPIESLEKASHVHLANGQDMVVYGQCDVSVQISSWRGIIKAIVIDLDAEFDLVLGLE
jgi:Aspartyl protease